MKKLRKLLWNQAERKVVPEVGLEPTRSKGTLDFESRASTNSTTPAPERSSSNTASLARKFSEEVSGSAEIIVPRIAKVKVRKSLTPNSKLLYFAISLNQVGP